MIALLGLVSLGLAGPPLDADKVARVKAAYLVNFVKYTKWPEREFANAGQPVRIVILGRDDLGRVIDEVAAGKAVRGRRIEIHRVAFDEIDHDAALQRAVREARDGHILYIGDGNGSLARAVARELADDAVLTVSDSSAFCRHGGMLGFVLRDNRIVFDANPDRIRRSGLAVSSKLLKLATIVREEEEKS